MKPSQLLASPVFWAAVADIRGLLSGEPLLPFNQRPTEQRSYLLNNAGQEPLGCGGGFPLKWGVFSPNFSCYSGGIGSFSIGIFSLSRALLEGGSSL